MNSQQQTKEKGFTIIEVVLVLAIAGLIFLMVFIALPALQRNQRDTARKSDATRVAAAVTTYRSNNRGANPLTGEHLNAGAFANYIDGTVSSSGRVEITQSENTVVASSTKDGYQTFSQTEMRIFFNSQCGPSNDLVAGNSKQFAIVMEMESGDARFCLNGS